MNWTRSSIRWWIIPLLLLLSVSGKAQSYGDLKAAYDEKVAYVSLLETKIKELKAELQLKQQAADARYGQYQTALDEANRQTGLALTELEAKQRELKTCSDELAVARSELKKYRPKTWAGRQIRKIRDGLAVVGGLTVVGAIIVLIIP